jgi:hypothetical protein
MSPDRAPSQSHTTCLPANCPRLLPHLSPSCLTDGISFGPVGCSTEAPMMQLSCNPSSVIATQTEIGPARRSSAQIKAYSASVVDSKQVSRTKVSTLLKRRKRKRSQDDQGQFPATVDSPSK